MPTAYDVVPFVPALDFEVSLQFYTALGWQLLWRDESGLAQLELANSRFLLQNFYVKQWAHNFMLYIPVDDAQAWYDFVQQTLAQKSFPKARVQPPREETFGARVTYAWDPSGVLLHFAQAL